ncbi:DUF917 domain-containing protein [soil metagenome]
MRMISAEDLDDMALGAAVLGTGGGGNPYIGRLMAQAALRKYGPVKLIDASELNDDDMVVPAAMMGAPTVMVEKIPAGHEVVTAFKKLEAYMGKPFSAVMSGEIGGLNSVVPFTVAAALGLPMVDADGMGRAFPELQMSIPAMIGVTAYPMAIADEKGNSAIISTINNHWTETLARTLTIDMGCSAMVALYAMTGRQVKDGAVLGTITQTEQIGRALREATANHIDPVEAVRAVTNGAIIWTGKISDIQRRTETGFARGDAYIAGLGPNEGETLQISFQNEFLIGRTSDRVLITTPDLITMLDAETGHPITTEELRYGFRVAVLAIPCDPRWRSEEGLRLAGPRYFGYDVDYLPFDQRIATN